MNTKLTLRIDESLIKSAKKYSKKTGKSLSRLVADLFQIIGNEKLGTNGEDSSLTPTVRSLKGILKGKAISEANYKSYIEKKYL